MKGAQAFTDHIIAVNYNIKVIHNDIRDNVLVFLDCSAHGKVDKSLNIDVYMRACTQYAVSTF